jgi:hypothetical protein
MGWNENDELEKGSEGCGNGIHYETNAFLSLTQNRSFIWGGGGLHPVAFVTKTLLWRPSIATKILVPLSHSRHYVFRPVRAIFR